MKTIIMSGIKELIHNTEEKFLVQWVVTSWATHLVMVLSFVNANASGPLVLNLNCAMLFRLEQRKKRWNESAKRNCGKRHGHGE